MDDTRHQLLEAAGPLFADRGFRATTVREICEAAKANQAAINYHFGDKENLYVECVRHAAVGCLTRVPVPSWPTGTPARVRLRDFVRSLIERLVVDVEPAWYGELLMREMLKPSKACVEFIKESVQPNFVVLQEILRDLLPQTPERKRVLIAFSIVGQVFHYRAARAAVIYLLGEAGFRALDVETLTEHITSFSLAAIDSIVDKAPQGGAA